MDKTDNKNKLYLVEFELNSKMLAMVYLCYKYKYSLSFFLTFYELYGDMSLYALKALSCSKKLKLTDTLLIKIIDESRLLYSQIIKGISAILKRKQLLVNNPKNEEIPEFPEIDLSVFSDEYRMFIEDYLLKNIEDIFAPTVKLEMSTDDIYKEIETCEMRVL